MGGFPTERVTGKRPTATLFHFATSCLGCDDSSLVNDLSHGMRIEGVIPIANVLVDRVRPARTSHSERTRSIPARNKANAERPHRPQGSRVALECWQRTLEDVERGWASTTGPATVLDMASCSLTSRFAKEETHGANQPKIRLDDDFRAIGVSNLVAPTDTDAPDTLDGALSIAPLFEKPTPGIELNVFSVDFRHACKNISIAADQRDYDTILLEPPSGPIVKASLYSQPFGSTRALANWARVVAFLRWVAS